MTEPTRLTLAEARDALKAKTLSATELTRAHLAAMEKGRALNAYVLETPEIALKMAAASDARLARGEAGPLEGLPLGIKDPLLHGRHAHDGLLQHPGQLHPALRIDRHQPALARRGRDARQAQQ